MAASKSELWDQYTKAIKIIDELYNFSAVNATNWLDMEDTLKTAYKGDHVGATEQQLTSMRASISSVINQGATLLNSLILELARIGYNSVAAARDVALDDIRQGMVDGSETVSERNFSFASVSAGVGNNGDGTVYRLTSDKNNFDLEGSNPAVGTVKLTCITDFATGRSKGAEEFQIKGDGQNKVDELNVGNAPDLVTTLTATTASAGKASNGDFEGSTGANPNIVFTGWVPSVQANLDEETTTVYRGSKCIKFTDNVSITQYLTAPSINKDLPMFTIIHFQRQSGCNGTLSLRLGLQSTSVVLSAQTGWNIIALGTTGTKGWYENYKEDSVNQGLRVVISLTGRTVGTLLIDECIVAQPTLYNGQYYLIKAGQSEFLVNDNFSFADTSAETGRTQYWTARLFNKYFPHTSGSPTYADA
jgi:hypothetical protein